MTRHTTARQLSHNSDLIFLIILIIGFGIRLIHLREPLIGEQAWRQTDTAAIARNYYEEGYDFFSPRVDWRGETDGAVESEFPIYPFLIALLYMLTGGVHEWIGRLLSVVFSMIGAWFLYNLVRRFYDIHVARYATGFFVISPLFAFYGQAFMPEAMMLACGIGALERFVAWDIDRSENARVVKSRDRLMGAAIQETVSSRRNAGTLVTSALLLAGSVLIKPQMLHLGLPLLYLIVRRYGKGFWKIPLFWWYAAIVLLPVIGWYAHAHTLFNRTHLTFGIWGREGYDKLSNYHLLTTWEFYGRLLKRCWEIIFTPAGLLLFIGGIVLSWRERKRIAGISDRYSAAGEMFLFWLGAVLITILIIPEGNWTLSYYQLPLLPVGAVFVGRGLAGLLQREVMESAGLRGRLTCGVLALVVIVGIGGASAYVLTDFYKGEYEMQGKWYEYTRAQHELGRELDSFLPKNALCIIADLDVNTGAPYRSQNPTMLYYLHRKGWQITPEEFRPEQLETLIRKGATYFIVPRRMIEQYREFSNYLLNNEDYKRYRKRPVRAQSWEFIIIQLR